MDINIFVQVGFVVLVGLACKNAILIVEFARDRQQEGESRVRRRRGGRPGAAAADPHDVVRVHPRRGAAGDSPTGAGAEMRRTLGTAVFAGMFGVTLFGIFLTPVFFYVVRWLTDRKAVEPGPARPRRGAGQGDAGRFHARNGKARARDPDHWRRTASPAGWS